VNARTILFAGVLTLISAGPLAASQRAPGRLQGQPPPAPAPGQPRPDEGPDAAISAGQIQRWFEAFTVLQAQEALQLSEAQYGRFVTRLKALQDVRRKHQLARNQIMGDLRRLTNPQTGSNDEASLTERLKALREEDDRAAVDVKKAFEGLDETLDIRQQARFRFFEERMEQQKLELLLKTRQNARAAARGRGKL
jgi:hypothetical protein